MTDINPTGAGNLPAARSVDIQPIPVEQITARMRAVEQVVSEVMVEGVHWGDVPGVAGQKMIDKPGIEILAATFQLALDYVVDAQTTPDGELRYIVKCRVLQQATEAYLGSGMGEASTAETKYMWRKASTAEYGATGEDRRRQKTWTDFKTGKTDVTLQVRENNVDKANTALKQACTRAARDAVLGVLGVRGMVLGRTPAGGKGSGQQQQGSRSQQRRQQAQQRPPFAGRDATEEMIGMAAERGVGKETILEDLRAERGYQAASLATLTADDCAWATERYSGLPVVDPVTGEVEP